MAEVRHGVEHRQELLEVSFVNSLMQKLVSNCTDFSKRFTSDIVVDKNIEALLDVSHHRINFTVVAIEKQLNPSIKGVPLSTEEFLESSAYFLEILNLTLSRYQVQYSSRSCREVLSERTTTSLLTTLMHIYGELRTHWDDTSCRNLEPVCGKLFSVLSLLHQYVSLQSASQLILRCVGQEDGVHVSCLMAISHLKLDNLGLVNLLTRFGDYFSSPKGAWKKGSLLEISYPLRSCILSWMTREPIVLRELYHKNKFGNYGSAFGALRFTAPASFTSCVSVIFAKMEGWTNSGCKKRAVLWPTVCLLMRLIPHELEEALQLLSNPLKSQQVNKGMDVVSLVARTLKTVVKNFRPSKLTSVLHKDAMLLSEVSIVFFVEYFHVSAILRSYDRIFAGSCAPHFTASVSSGNSSQQRLNSGTAAPTLGGAAVKTPEFESDYQNNIDIENLEDIALPGELSELDANTGEGFNVQRQSDHHPSRQRNQSKSSSAVPTNSNNVSTDDSHAHELLPFDDFIQPHRDKLEDMLLSGQHPSLLFYSALDNSVIDPSEYSAVTLLSTYMWSLFFIDRPEFVRLSLTVLGLSSGSNSSSSNNNGSSVGSGPRVSAISAIVKILHHTTSAAFISTDESLVDQSHGGGQSWIGTTSLDKSNSVQDNDSEDVPADDDHRRISIRGALLSAATSIPPEQAVLSPMRVKVVPRKSQPISTFVKIHKTYSFWCSAPGYTVKISILNILTIFAHGLIGSGAGTSSGGSSTEQNICRIIAAVVSRTGYRTVHIDDHVVSGGSASAVLSGIMSDVSSVLSILKLIEDNPYFLYVRNAETLTSTKSSLSFEQAGQLNAVTDSASNIHPLFPTVYLAFIVGMLGDILTLLRSPDSTVCDAAAATLTAVITVPTVRLWHPKDVFVGILCVSSFVMLRIAILLNSYQSNHTVRIFELLYHILDTVNKFFVEAEDDGCFQLSTAPVALINLRSFAVSSIESSIIIHISSCDVDVAGVASQCLRVLCVNHDHIEGRDSSSNSSCWIVYKKLTDSANLLLMPTERQQMIRNLLGGISSKSLGVRWALLEVRNRWNDLSAIVQQAQEISVIATVFDEWSNCSSFLCALAEGLGESSSMLNALNELLQSSPLPSSTSSGSLSGMPRSKSYQCLKTVPQTPTTTTADVLPQSDEASRLIRAKFVAKEIIEYLLFLIVFPHSGDKRISQNAFISIGRYLSEAMMGPLFDLLSQILKQLSLCLSQLKSYDNEQNGNQPSSKHDKHQHSRPNSSSQFPVTGSPGGNVMVNINAILSDNQKYANMNLQQILFTTNSFLTMLQMIFSRAWYSKIDFTTTNVEDIVLKLAIVSGKLHPSQQPLSSNNSNNGGSVGGSYDNSRRNSISSVVSSQYPHADLTQSAVSGGIPGRQQAALVSATVNNISLADSLRLKKKVADMAETFMRNSFNIRISNSFCIRMVAYLVKWAFTCLNAHFSARPVSNASTSNGLNSTGFNDSTVTSSAFELDLHRSTELACIQASVVLFHGTVIVPEEIESFSEDVASFILLPIHSDMPKNFSALERRSQIFFKFFHVLSCLLSSCDGSDSTQINITSMCIEALTNLLCANLSIGFGHVSEACFNCVSDGVRVAYLQVFSEMLIRQREFFDAKEDSAEDVAAVSYEDSLQALCRMVVQEDITFKKLLCTVGQGTRDSEMLANCILVICSSVDSKNMNCGTVDINCSTLPSNPISTDISLPHTPLAHYGSGAIRMLLEALIPVEVAATVRLGSLFRSESICSKLMGAFFSKYGKTYLRTVLSGPLKHFIDADPDVEIDPSRMENSGSTALSVDQKYSTLESYSLMFLESILNPEFIELTISNDMKLVLFMLREETYKKFGSKMGCDRISVGGYFFLRFVCPAIAMPGKYGLLSSAEDTCASPSLSKRNSRGLLLIVKILQNLANGTHFTEDYMLSINDWLDDHEIAFAQFCVAISTPKVAEFVAGEVKDVSTEGAHIDELDDEDVEEHESYLESVEEPTEINNLLKSFDNVADNDVELVTGDKYVISDEELSSDDDSVGQSDGQSDGDILEHSGLDGDEEKALCIKNPAEFAKGNVSLLDPRIAHSKSTSSLSLSPVFSPSVPEERPNTAAAPLAVITEEAGKGDSPNIDEKVETGVADVIDVKDEIPYVSLDSEEIMEASVKLHHFFFKHKNNLLLNLATSSESQMDPNINMMSPTFAPLHSVGTFPGMFSSGGHSPAQQLDLLPTLPVQEAVSILIHQLGDPSDQNQLSVVKDRLNNNGTAAGNSTNNSKMMPQLKISPECSQFLTVMEAKAGFSERYTQIQQKRIFYCTGLPDAASFIFVLRRVEEDTDMTMLLYTIVKEIHNVAVSYSSKISSIDFVLDSCSFNFESYFQQFTTKKWWDRLKLFLGSVVEVLLKKIYVLFPSKELVDVTRRILKLWDLKSQTVAQYVVILLPSQLSERLPHVAADYIHSNCLKMEQGIEQRWPATRHGKSLHVAFSHRMLLLENQDTFGGLCYKRTDMIPLLHINSVMCGSRATQFIHALSSSNALEGSAPHSAASPPTPSLVKVPSSGTKTRHSRLAGLIGGLDDTVLVTLSWHSRSFRLHSPNAKALESAYNAALNLIRQQSALEEAVKWAGTKSTVSTNAIPGTLLFAGIFSLFSPLETTRRCAYMLIGRLHEVFHLPFSVPLYAAESVCLPAYPLSFAHTITTQIALCRPEYSLEFVFACVDCFANNQISRSRRIACLMCMRPWLPTITLLLDTLQRGDIHGKGHSDSSSKNSSSVTSSLPDANTAIDSNPQQQSSTMVGSRNFDDVLLDELIAKLVNMFELMLRVYCEDEGMSVLVMSEFWADVSKDVKLTSFVLKCFMNKWIAESNYPSDGPQAQYATVLDPLLSSQMRQCQANTVPDTPAKAQFGGESASWDRKDLSGGGWNAFAASNALQSTPMKGNGTGYPGVAVNNKYFSSSPMNYGASGSGNVAPQTISVQCNSMCHITSRLAIEQPSLVSTLLLSRVIRLINVPQSNPNKGDGNNPASGLDLWSDVIALFRPILFLPFQNAQFLAARLPDLFHMIILLVTQGPSSLRIGVHTLSCSILHSLVAVMTSQPHTLSQAIGLYPKVEMSKGKSGDNAGPLECGTPKKMEATSSAESDISVQALVHSLNLMNNSHFHFIFYEASVMTLNNLEMLIQALCDVVLVTKSEICEKWRRRWWQISFATASETLPGPSSARCYLTLSMLCKIDDLDHGVWSKLFEALDAGFIAEIQRVADGSGDCMLLCHMLRSFSKLAKFMHKSQLYYLFWVVLLILQMADYNVFPEVLRLLSCLILEILRRDPSSCLEDEMLSFRSRHKSLHVYLSKVEEGCIGISFDTRSHFAFSLSISIIAGLSLPLCRDLVVEMLHTLAKQYKMSTSSKISGISSDRPTPNAETSSISGYSVVLLPMLKGREFIAYSQMVFKPQHPAVATGDVGSINANGGVGFSSSSLQKATTMGMAFIDFFGPHNFPDNCTVVLFLLTLLVTMGHLEMEEHQLKAFKIFRDATRAFPVVVFAMQDVIFVELMRLYHESKNAVVAEALLSVINESFGLAEEVSAATGRKLSRGGEGYSGRLSAVSAAQEWNINEEVCDLSAAEIRCQMSQDIYYGIHNYQQEDTKTSTASPEPTESMLEPNKYTVNSNFVTSRVSIGNPPAELITGYMYIKRIGFSEFLYISNFDKRPVCQTSIWNRLCSTISHILAIMVTMSNRAKKAQHQLAKGQTKSPSRRSKGSFSKVKSMDAHDV